MENEEFEGEENKEDVKIQEALRIHIEEERINIAEDPWIKIKLYYIMESQRFDQWEEYQHKLENGMIFGVGEEAEMIPKILSKSFKEISPEERCNLATAAFRAALGLKEMTIMCDILRIETYIALNLEDMDEIVRTDSFPVIKAFVEKPAPVIYGIRRAFRISRYHKQERLREMLQENKENQVLELGDFVEFMISKRFNDDKIAQMLEFLHHTQDNSAILALLSLKREKLAELAFSEGWVSATDEVLNVCLDFHCFNFLLLYLKISNYEIFDGNIVEALFKKIVKGFSEDLSHTEIYLYLMRKLSAKMPYSAARLFIDTLNDWMRAKDLLFGFVKGSTNPAKICLLILEVLDDIGSRHGSLEKWTLDKKKDISELSCLLLNEIHDDMELHSILSDLDLDGRMMTEIAAVNGYLDIFKHKSISTVTEKIWSGPYNCTENPISATSMIWINLTHNPFSRIDIFTKNYTKIFHRDYTTFGTHNYQFVTWRDGLHCRYMLEAMTYWAAFFYLYYFFNYNLGE